MTDYLKLINLRLSAIERTLKLQTIALNSILKMEKNDMSTVKEILDLAHQLADANQAAKVNEDHLLEAANKRASELQAKLDEANAAIAAASTANQPAPIEQADLDAIAAELAKAKAIADAMASAPQG